MHAPTGTPTVGATVSVTTGANAGRSAQSDIEGRFTLANVQPGTFTVEVVLGLLGTVLRRDVQLTQDTTLELSWTPPPPPVFALGGRVTDLATGAALAGASVAVIDGVNTGRGTTTAADGTYRLTDLTFGGFTLRVRYSGYDSQFRAVRLTGDTTLDVQMRPAMQSLAGTWTGSMTATTPGNPNVQTTSIPELNLTHAAAEISGVYPNTIVLFTGTLRNPSAIGATTEVTGVIRLEVSQGGRNIITCHGSGAMSGSVNWTRLAIVAPQVPFDCGFTYTNVTVSLVKQQ